MVERKYDSLLAIKTRGLREWGKGEQRYNRYEATPYAALDRLFEHYRLRQNAAVVDFGSGRGRVAFYMHHRFRLPVTGIEVHDKTFTEALNNKARYRQRFQHIKAPIRFEFGLAEHYQIRPEENCFYFFNPFSADIFKQVVKNILAVKAKKGPADIILYYPLAKYKKVLHKKTPFKLINKVPVPGAKEKREKFLIYRWAGEEHHPQDHHKVN